MTDDFIKLPGCQNAKMFVPGILYKYSFSKISKRKKGITLKILKSMSHLHHEIMKYYLFPSLLYASAAQDENTNQKKR